MARGRKTGGRSFKKGNRGRPRGAKDKFPRGSIKAIYVGLAQGRPELFGRAIVAGISAKPPFSFQYLQLGAYYIDGKPVETIRVQPDLSKYTPDELLLLERLIAKGTS